MPEKPQEQSGMPGAGRHTAAPALLPLVPQAVGLGHAPSAAQVRGCLSHLSIRGVERQTAARGQVTHSPSRLDAS